MQHETAIARRIRNCTILAHCPPASFYFFRLDINLYAFAFFIGQTTIKDQKLHCVLHFIDGISDERIPGRSRFNTFDGDGLECKQMNSMRCRVPVKLLSTKPVIFCNEISSRNFSECLLSAFEHIEYVSYTK